ncbi:MULTISPECIES: glycosyltransferase family 2 protein [Niastella]|uniref:Glycosyltransferase family 2 protein n=1 Tax=Niastella soli TaxID=2821487 RepID=A0ABS3YZE1_9BACT|nr:glycosyltransferase family 2 protein [Niastella soli]MBO9203296.1 glycosyltransferase family 2 protein [Niastella soli]
MPHVAIVLLNYNGKHYLEQNLGFVQQCSYPNKKVYLIDNGSTDDSLAFAQAYHPDVRIIRNSTNLGYAAGYNAGLAQITADYFVLLNTDVEVTPQFLEPVITLMEGDAAIGICQPRILSSTNRTQFEYAGGAGGFIDALGITFARGRVFDVQEQDNGQYDDNTAIFWASGACLIIKASLFSTLHGFYGYYFMYSEEVDLCWRAQALGFKVYACPKSIVYHRETTRLTDQPADRLYYIFRNNYVMLHRNLPLLSACTILPARFVLNKAAFIHLLFIGRFAHAGSIIKATLHYLKWALFTKKERIPQKALRSCQGVFKGSIVYQYYLLKKKKFSDIVPNHL